MGRKRRRVERTEDWGQLELLCVHDEQVEYERIRPLVLFGEPVPDRAEQTGTSERTLYRRIAGFEEDGMQSLLGSEPAAKRRLLPASLRRLIVDLKAEHPALNLNEIARTCHVRTGRRPHLATVRSVLDEEPLPIKAFRRFPPYHEILEGRERRKAVVALHYEGWADKSIACYLRVDRSTVRRVLKRWELEGPEGLEDKKRGRPKGVQKVDLRAMVEVRRRQENPELGAYRMRVALEQVGIFLSTRTVGRILAANREAERLPKPKRSPHTKREMPFEASYRHEYWTSDVRYLDHSIPETGQAYVISSWRTTPAPSSRAPLHSPRTRTLTSLCSTPPRSVTAPRGPSSPTGRASSSPTGRRRSTAPWASARRRSRGASPGKASSRRPSTFSAEWPTTTSPGQEAGRSWWPSTTAGWPATTRKGTGRTREGKTAGGARRRYSVH